MDDQRDLSELEIIGIAAAAAAALGGLVIGLSRGQERSVDTDALKIDDSRVSGAVQSARSRVPELKQSLQENLQGVAESIPRAVQRAQEPVQQHVPERDKLQGEVSSRVERLGELVRSAVSSTQKRLPEGRDSAAETIMPVAQDVKNRLQRAFEDRRPDLDESSEKISHAMDDLRHRAEASLQEQRQRVEELSHTVSDEGSRAGKRVAKKSSSVAKETTMAIFWFSAASALVYFVLMSPERREQVKSMLCGGLEQARLLMLDLRGYEPEY